MNENEMKETMLRNMGEAALAMRPQLNEKQLIEVVTRSVSEFQKVFPTTDAEVVMRIEFHADDVLGYSDEEYSYSGEEE